MITPAGMVRQLGVSRMAVSLPSDLILDVIRNADPTQARTAAARLQMLGGPENGESFAAMLAGPASSSSSEMLPGTEMGILPAPPSTGSGSATGAFADFERMVLRNLFESLLPDAGSGAFGPVPSAGVWRSLAADQLAGVYAGTGGIGIARTLEGSGHEGAQGQWPYFTSGKIEAFVG